MTESEPLMEMDPAPSEQSTPSTMFSGGLSAPGQREGHLYLPSCEPVLIFSFNLLFSLFPLQKAFTALCHSTHLYGRRLVLEWADTEETLEALRRKTDQHFHGKPLALPHLAHTRGWQVELLQPEQAGRGRRQPGQGFV